MDSMLVNGGAVLSGVVETSGAKNSALPIIFSSLLAEGEHIFNNVPDAVEFIQCTHGRILNNKISYT